MTKSGSSFIRWAEQLSRLTNIKKSIKTTMNMTKLKQMDLVCIPLKLLLKRDPNYFISDMNFSYSASAPYVAFSAEETGGGNGGFAAQGMFPVLCD